MTLKPATDQVIQLSLDDAIQRGLTNNLGLKEAENAEKTIRGQQLQALQEFLPTITLTGDTGYYQHDLAALGFKGSSLPPSLGVKFPAVTHDTLTEGQIHYDQILFSGPVIAGWKAAGAATRVAHFAKMTARGEVIQQVASAYLHALASSSEVDNAKALEQADLVQLNHAHEQRVAGVGTSLDELRARVQYQTQQQATIVAQNEFDKDLILLKREIGLDPGQKIVLTDQAPFSELTDQTPEELRALAYKSRQDYQNLQNQVQELKAVHSAYRSQRYPTLSFSGNYGVQAITTIGSHGVFSAVGTLSVPIFREARIRGDIDAAQAQLKAANSQLDDLRSRIDQQVRSALLDVSAARKLVDVARSNVDLSTRALSDQTERTNAGIDDTLPLVTAQAALANAQTSSVESIYQYNLSKLSLARAAGVLEQQYHYYLGK
ncbi:TolC family protein [Occallatibacter riparius]|uniref:TolC family protein n=1 Tax=Occallatibacter riparius TaxID=1002689 RepID=A0A9J7BN89_9BACT|nr:TolC family protein [Occallatibacter riparius]UWZ84356.1 TolC family protein [Occallatibacter riparius]